MDVFWNDGVCDRISTHDGGLTRRSELRPSDPISDVTSVRGHALEFSVTHGGATRTSGDQQ